jgi:hypothetical protein
MSKFDLNFWWYEHKDNVIAYGWFGFVITLVASVTYYNYAHPSRSNQIRNETHCAQFMFFSADAHKIDTGYFPVVMYNDSIVNITTPQGKTWWAKDFIDNQSIIVDETTASDITIKDGSRYRIIPLDSGRCLGKVVMDSIRNTYTYGDDDTRNDN